MKTFNNNIEYLRKVKDLLINIDMVNGFVKEGPLAASSIMRVVPRQIELTDDALFKNDAGIVFIRDSHVEDAVEFKNYPLHCLEGSKESELIPELKDYERFAKTYFKNSTNLIFAPGIMDDLLKLEDLERVRLMGCLSEVCVENGAVGLKTFFDQYNKDVEVCVYEDAIDTFDAPGHNADEVTQKALKDMEANGVKVLRKVR